MKKILLLLLTVSMSLGKLTAQTVQADLVRPSYGATDVFTYDSKSVTQYGLNWVSDSWDPNASAYLTSFGGIRLFTGGTPRFNITSSGLFGINVAAPAAVVDVLGPDVPSVELLRLSQPNQQQLKIFGQASSQNLGSNNGMYITRSGGALGFGTAGSNAEMIILANGSVGIGTLTTGTNKLAVEGKIGAREVKVSLETWADYVFEKNYNLRSLNTLEKYIEQNKHLPGVPSAKEVEADGGFELGKMNVKLLEKVEELTLYVIQLKKENQEIKNDLKKVMRKR